MGCWQLCGASWEEVETRFQKWTVWLHDVGGLLVMTERIALLALRRRRQELRMSGRSLAVMEEVMAAVEFREAKE